MTPEATHILLFEPRLGGHHLSWHQYITEAFLSAGFRVTLAVDDRPGPIDKIRNQLDQLVDAVPIVSLFDASDRFRGGGKLSALAACMEEAGADEAFLNNFDEVASGCLRRAAFGLEPPSGLQGRINGVYFRPRFLVPTGVSPGNFLKRIGFRRLCRAGWFKRLYLLDEYLYAGLTDSALYHFLPDPWSGRFDLTASEARGALGISEDVRVFLHYGIGDRRKGLHLAIQAMLSGPEERRWLLLCAGELDKDSAIQNGMAELQQRGQAKVLNHYVSDDEERLCFCASDVVLLPYVRHFGSSGVLSLAAAAGKIIIASDEGLVARRVLDHRLGKVFTSGNAAALSTKMVETLSLPSPVLDRYRQAALTYADGCSREAFRNALLTPFMKTERPNAGAGGI